jgi:DNA-binding FadR family transcriptional regulator
MIEEMRPLLERFPEDEQTIRELRQKDEAFRFLCQEYHQIASELQHADSEAARDLTHRHAALEEEMMRRIEGYQPI